jgi:hypothetical protein
MPKQLRAQDTIDLVLAEARAAIKQGGEAAVRVQDISAKVKGFYRFYLSPLR